MASKILVTGAVNGNFQAVFKKISALHAKNAFSFALIIGDLFHDPSTANPDDESNIEALISGSIEVPLPTYVSMGKRSLPAKVIEKIKATEGEICDNLIFLGKCTKIKTSEGVRLVGLGGSLDPNIIGGTSKDNYTASYSTNDAHVLRGANSADLLITSDWPSSIEAGSKTFQSLGTKGDELQSQQCIAELSAALRPRYHFSVSSMFFEREPFVSPIKEDGNDTGLAITRFISLAPFGDATKQKWIYAFTLDPTATPSNVMPPGATPSPFARLIRKRPAETSREFSRYDTRPAENHHKRPNKRNRQPPPGPDECFFCLSNPNLATHLVTSIGTDAYLTTAKGPLSTGDTFPAVGFPCHLLIIPLAHTATLNLIADVATKNNTLLEMNRYRTSLNAMIKVKSGGKLGSVTWEISRGSGIHAHWQYLPVPADLIKKGLVEAAFKVEAQNEHYPTMQVAQKRDDLPARGDYFTATVWASIDAPSQGEDITHGTPLHDEVDHGSGEARVHEMVLKLPLDDSFRFNLQFGRQVLGKLLKLEQRIHWRDCEQTMEEETIEAEAFKKAWQEYDFTMEGQYASQR